eukprot:TRINITY_DN5998_c0_g1_i1.p1 TRINITY_DN5998_c0_g1~~TRINITY_DN5998_c0_g1_i1.p1  ORF type:complete len:1016 (-),score=196.11 TRINITY_DN5998_c0_g1_i1:2646-5693(-)
MISKELAERLSGLKEPTHLPDEILVLGELISQVTDSNLLVTELSPATLNRLALYLFDRRFGWSEHTIAVDSGQKKQVNDLSDSLLSFIDRLPLCAMVTEMFHFVSCETSIAVSRQQAYLHFYTWLQQTCDTFESFAAANAQLSLLFDSLQRIVIDSVTDVWSAIRKSSSQKLAQCVQYLSLEQVRSVFCELVQICNESSSWQAQEGAVLGITTLVKKACIADGTGEFAVAKEDVFSSVKDVCFRMLAHSQLSVRENAIRALGAFLSRCEFRDTLDAFCECMLRLHNGVSETAEAEGLLGVVDMIVRSVPANCIFPQWSDYFATLNLYAAHSASTVRQMTSAILFRLACMDGNPFLLRLVLQTLAANWSGPAGLNLAAVPLPVVIRPLPAEVLRKFSDDSLAPSSTDWEWREGRLLAYELILNHLLAAKVTGGRRASLAFNPAMSPAQCIGLFSPVSPITAHHQFVMPPSTEPSPKSEVPSGSLAEQLRILEPSAEGLRQLSESVGMGDVQSELVSPSRLLSQMLVQTVSCFAETRFELRRMADQVLPRLTEVISYYDFSSLKSFWKTILDSKDETLIWGGCLTLKLVLRRLSDVTTRRRAGALAADVRDAITPLLPLLCTLARSSTSEALTVLIMELLVLLNSYYREAVPRSQRPVHMSLVLSYVEAVYQQAQAHGGDAPAGTDNRLVVSPSKGRKPVRPEGSPKPVRNTFAYPVVSPTRNAAVPQHARTERALVASLHSALADFVGILPINDVLRLIPFLSHYAATYDDGEVQKSLLGALERCHTRFKMALSVDVTIETALESSGDFDLDDSFGSTELPTAIVDTNAITDACGAAALRLLSLLTHELETSMLRRLCDLLAAFLQLAPKRECLASVLACVRALAARRTQGARSPGRVDAEMMASLSNDIPSSAQFDQDTPSDSESSEPVGANYDANHEGSGSDWDDWDEDEEEVTANAEVIELGRLLHLLGGVFLQSSDRPLSVAQRGQFLSQLTLRADERSAAEWALDLCAQYV